MSSRYYFSDAEGSAHQRVDPPPPLRRRRRPFTQVYGVAEPEAERIGAFVARHLVPAVRSHPDQPVQLVLNFGGALHLGPGGPPGSRFGAQDRPRAAPGIPAVGVGQFSSSSESEAGSRPRRTVGYCLGCCRRQVVGPAGICWDCKLLNRERDRRERGDVGWVEEPHYMTVRDPWTRGDARTDVRRETRDEYLGARRYPTEYWGGDEIGGVGYRIGHW